jgi:hypothetical protein
MINKKLLMNRYIRNYKNSLMVWEIKKFNMFYVHKLRNKYMI